MRGQILIVGKETAVSRLMETNLRMFGYQTVCVSEKRQAAEAVRAQRFDAALCDAALRSDEDGGIASALRAQDVPVIFVSAGDKDTRAAEDAVNPANMREIMARLDALFCREDRKPSALTYRNIAVDEENRTVTLDGQAVPLKQMEYKLLLTFLRHPGVAWTREELLRQVWGDEAVGSTRTVDVHVAALRRKLLLSRELTTVYRIGYRFDSQE